MANRVFSWNQPNSVLDALGEDTFASIKETSLGSHCASTYTLSSDTGEGYIELHSIDPQISLAIFNCRWFEETKIEIQDADRVRLNFSLDLDVLMELSLDELVVNQPSWRIVNNMRKDVVHEAYSAESKTIWVTIGITSEYIPSHFGDELLTRNDELTSLFTTSEKNSVYREYPLDHQISQIVSNIVSSHLDERLYLAYVKCKATELICIALERVVGSQGAVAMPIKLTPRDEKAINLAKEILLSNLGKPLTVKEICQMIGMNRNKLHYGFKAVFGISMSKYLQEERLVEAYKQLEETSLSILQIAGNVGYRHQSSFSTAFRKKYGFSPHLVRKL